MDIESIKEKLASYDHCLRTMTNISPQVFLSCKNAIYSFQNNHDYDECSEIFETFVGLIRNFTESKFQEVSVCTRKSVVYIETMCKIWSHFRYYLYGFNLVLNTFATSYPGIVDVSIAYQGLLIFKEHFLDAVWSNLSETLLFFVEEDRSKRPVPRAVIKDCINMMIEVGYDKDLQLEKNNQKGKVVFMYGGELKPETQVQDYHRYFIDYFEKDYFNNIRDIYTSLSGQWINNTSPEYCQLANESCDKEEALSQDYILRRDEAKARLNDILIWRNYKQIIGNPRSGVDTMLEGENFDNLKILYKFLGRAEGHGAMIPGGPFELMTTKLSEYVKRKGQELFKSKELISNPVEFMKKLIALKIKADKFVSQSFESNILFENYKDKHFNFVINSAGSDFKIHLIFARYINEMIRTDLSKNVADEETNEKLDEFIDVIRGFGDQDMFIETYKNFIAPRVLETSNFDIDRKFLQKLGASWGTMNLNRIMRLFDDIKNSEDINMKWENFNTSTNTDGKLSVRILTKPNWPAMFQVSSLIQPLSDRLAVFSNFFKNKAEGGSKTLEWVANYGTAEVRASFNKNYFLEVSTIQLSVLLLLDEDKTLSYQELVQSIDCEKHLNNGVKVLLKLKLLKTTGSSDQIKGEDKISINNDFTSAKIKLKCNLKMKTSQNEKPEHHDDDYVLKARENVLDSVIVRIMKSRKMLSHNNLLEEIMKLVTLFRPDPKMVKKRLESLIDRSYLTRDEENRNTYQYLP